MTECEICGGRASAKSKIDGAVLDVCDDCAKLGEKMEIPVKKEKKIHQRNDSKLESSKHIDPDYPKIIKKAREKRGMKIDDLAKAINEKSSVISRLERRALSPSFNLAKKLENFLEIKLILEYEEEDFSTGSEDSHSVTIGDVVDLGELDD